MFKPEKEVEAISETGDNAKPSEPVSYNRSDELSNDFVKKEYMKRVKELCNDNVKFYQSLDDVIQQNEEVTPDQLKSYLNVSKQYVVHRFLNRESSFYGMAHIPHAIEVSPEKLKNIEYEDSNFIHL